MQLPVLRVCVCVLTQIREGGLAALYKGMTPVMLRAFPANAVSVLYTYIHRMALVRLSLIVYASSTYALCIICFFVIKW